MHFLSQNMQITHLICTFLIFKNVFGHFSELVGAIKMQLGEVVLRGSCKIRCDFCSKRCQLTTSFAYFLYFLKPFLPFFGTGEAYRDVTWWGRFVHKIIYGFKRECVFYHVLSELLLGITIFTQQPTTTSYQNTIPVAPKLI